MNVRLCSAAALITGGPLRTRRLRRLSSTRLNYRGLNYPTVDQYRGESREGGRFINLRNGIVAQSVLSF